MKDLKSWLTKKQLERTAELLKERGYEVFLVEDREEAKNKVLSLIPQEATVGIGGSITIREIGVIEELEKRGNKVIHHWKEGLTPEQDLEIRRQELLSDVFLSSVNALTFSGEIVNMEAIGNRVAAQIFGPKKVIVVVGRNKLVVNLETAIWRIKNIVTPLNAKRLKLELPCADEGYCMNCNHPNRICRITTILEAPPSRTPFTVILVNEDLGF
ncbi:MAG: lactate utilization protein [Dictyoglomus turgidum]|uniref:lactate utilization protein n=1 Tax=Dictyoglomus TaxID=13 RepID=UPI003C7231F6